MAPEAEAMLQDKKIIVGITAGIAAYKAAILVRALVKKGAQVQVILTEKAKKFVTPLTLATLSKRPALSALANEADGTWHNHVELGLWADLMLVAPATANTLAKMANGQADSLLLTTYLSARCPVVVAPAMDLDMYAHPSTRENLRRLAAFGNIVLEAPAGELASGLVGQGRMMEPEDIVAALERVLGRGRELEGLRALVNAGPTHEAIDPVRFIGNHSSGKMGLAIARELAERGAQVCLVAGPIALRLEHPRVERVDVVSAREMLQACLDRWPGMDCAILSAAVADYRPAEVAPRKIKRDGEALRLELVPNPDIAAEMGKAKRPGQILAGFALETNDELRNAQAKLQRKGLDFIVLNSLAEPGAGFAHDTNRVTLVDALRPPVPFPLKTKDQVAADIVDHLALRLGRAGNMPDPGSVQQAAD